jgi:hypothetical protein
VLFIAALSLAALCLASCDRNAVGGIGIGTSASVPSDGEPPPDAAAPTGEPPPDAAAPTGESVRSAWDPGAPFDQIAPDGFSLGSIGDSPTDEVAAIMDGRTVPLTTTTAVFVSEAKPSQYITATLLTYPDMAGALAMYNRWFSDYGFIPVAERRTVPLGDQAECFDAGWPPFHAVVLREGPLFALVQADREVALDRCAALLADLLSKATS